MNQQYVECKLWKFKLNWLDTINTNTAHYAEGLDMYSLNKFSFLQRIALATEVNKLVKDYKNSATSINSNLFKIIALQ